MFINKVILYGNLTRDPELRALPSGQNVCNFGVATNRTFIDKDGKKQELAEFHNVVAFGRTADLVAQYLKKGRGVYVEGRLQTRSWDDKKTNEKKYRTEIFAESIQFGPRGAEGAGNSSYGSAPARHDAPTQSEDSFGSQSSTSSGIEYPKDEINPEDIPF